MRQFPKVLFLLCAAIAVPLGAETISEHEPTRFDPYREPAQPLSLAPHWIARTQQFSNFAPPANSNVGRVYQSPAQLTPTEPSVSPPRSMAPLPNPIYNGTAGPRFRWTGNRQYQQRLNAGQNDVRFYQNKNQKQQATSTKLDFYVRGLIMSKENTPIQSLTQGPGGQLITTQDADMDSAGGFEATLRKALPDQTRGELVYWGLFTTGDSATMEDVSSGIQTTLDISRLNYGSNGEPLANQLQVSQVSLQRDFQYHNLELNWGGTARGEQVTLEYLAGLRYFKASEGLALQMDDFSFIGHDDNHLIGLQAGALLNWQPQQQLEIHAGVKFGVFVNSIDHQMRFQGANGFAYSGSDASTQQLNHALDTSDVATLGQLDVGFTYHWSDRFRLTSGYRLVGVTGLSLTTNQLSQDLADLAENPSVHTNGSILLHGAYVGVEYDF